MEDWPVLLIGVIQFSS